MGLPGSSAEEYFARKCQPGRNHSTDGTTTGGTMILLKPILCLLLTAAATQVDVFKKEMAPLQNSVDAAVAGTGAQVMSNSKATYLEGYGVIVVLEITLERPRSPFDSVKTPDAIRTTVTNRQKDVTTKLSELLKERIGKTESLGATDSLAFIFHILNTNPADVP